MKKHRVLTWSLTWKVLASCHTFLLRTLQSIDQEWRAEVEFFRSTRPFMLRGYHQTLDQF